MLSLWEFCRECTKGMQNHRNCKMIEWKNLGFTLYGVTFHKRVTFHVGKSQNINKTARKVRLRDKMYVNMKQSLHTVCQYCCRATLKRLRQREKVYTVLCCVVLCCVRTGGREDHEQNMADLTERKTHNLLRLFFSICLALFAARRTLSSFSCSSLQRWKFSTTTPTNMLSTKKPTRRMKEIKYRSRHSE